MRINLTRGLEKSGSVVKKGGSEKACGHVQTKGTMRGLCKRVDLHIDTAYEHTWYNLQRRRWLAGRGGDTSGLLLKREEFPRSLEVCLCDAVG